MAKQKEAKKINVKSPEGKEFQVTEKAFDLVYADLGYKEVKKSK